MCNGNRSEAEVASVNSSNAPTGAPDTSSDGSNKDKAVALSELIDGMIESLKQLKNPSFSNADLKKLGIALSFQDLPCTFDICLTKETGTNEETTRIRRELKQILKKKFSSQVRGGKVYSGEKYLTYVDVGIEHCVKPSKRGAGWKNAGVVALGVIVALLALVGVVSFANWLSPPRQKTEITNSVVRQFDGTNLTQKAEISVEYEDRGK